MTDPLHTPKPVSLKLKSAAALMDLSPDTLIRAEAKGELAFKSMGGYRMVLYSELVRWAESWPSTRDVAS
ncbi:excise [Gordonia phage Kuwabara]|nr:excise [Gordonia phage Kuwabara]